MTQEQKKTLLLLRIVTVIYVLLYPFIFQMALMSFMIADSPSMTASIYYPVVIASLSVPIMMVISIWKMWAYYVKKAYRRARLYSLFPVIFLGIVSFFVYLVT